MTDTKSELAVFAAIDTTDSERAKRPAPRRPTLRFRPDRTEVSEVDQFDLLSSAPPIAAPRIGLLRRLKNAILGKLALHFAWMAFSPLVLHPAWAIDGATAVCAGIARLRGYKLDKAPDTDAGRALTKAFGGADGTLPIAKPSLAARVINPVKDTAAKPVEVVKGGAKKAVGKAEEKAGELKNEVKEQAQGLKEAIQNAKPADDDSPPGDDPEAPGLLDKVKGKLTDARNAVAEKIHDMQGEPLSPEEAQRRIEKAKRDLHTQKVRYLKWLNQVKLSNIAAWEGQVGRQAMADYNAWLGQREAAINQMTQGNAAYVNQAIRRGR